MGDESALTIAAVPLAFAEGTWTVDCAIAFSGGVIVAVGKLDELRATYPDAAVEDWGDVALLPGTVNAHTHSYQALLRGFGDDVPFSDWMGRLVRPTASTLDRAALQLGAAFSFAEMVRAGITTVVEFFNHHDGGNDNARAVIETARQIGIRLVLARCMLDAPSGPPRFVETPQLSESNCRELIADVNGDPMAHVHPAAHSVLQTSPEMLSVANGLAIEFDLPLHIHVADSHAERAACLERFDTTSVAYLDRLGVLDEHLLAVHAVAVDESDLDLLAARGATVVHNPSSNAILGAGIAPLVAMCERGIPVCLGTDAAAANNRQSVFEEMRMAALLAKACAGDPTAFTAEQALLLGTEAGGTALQLPVGRIAPGYFADFVAVDRSSLSVQPRSMVGHNVVYSMQQDAIAFVVVAGRRVVDGGKFHDGVELKRLISDVNGLTSGWMPFRCGGRS